MRQRIVINVDGPEGDATKPARMSEGKRRRWPRVLAILAGLFLAIVVALIVAGFLGWRYYQSTPTYTLALILDAAQRNDVAEFQKRFDSEEIAKNMVRNVSQKAAGRYGLALNDSVQQRIESITPSLVPRLKQTINDEVFKAIRLFALAPEQRSFITILGAVQSLMTVTTEGEIAKATGTMGGRKVELTMRRDGNRWKVVEVNEDVIVQTVVDAVMKELPAIGSIQSDSPLFKKPQNRRRNRGR